MDIFSNLMVIGECLLDTRRTMALKRAIEASVKPGDMVMDVGTGSGILAMFAARAGAKRVYGVEITPEIAEFARENIRANGLSDTVEIVMADIKDFNFPQDINLITMELMDTWLVSEQQAVALNKLRQKGVITSKTKLIPYRYVCLVELVNYDFNFYGLKMPFVIQARNFAVNSHVKKKLSRTKVFKDIELRKRIETEVEESQLIEIAAAGELNALVLKAKIYLTPGQTLLGTTDSNMPVIVPVGPVRVKSGDKVSVKVKYSMAEGFDKFRVSVKLKSHD